MFWQLMDCLIGGGASVQTALHRIESVYRGNLTQQLRAIHRGMKVAVVTLAFLQGKTRFAEEGILSSLIKWAQLCV